MNLGHLIFFLFFFIYNIETGKIRPNFDEIFGEEWDESVGNDVESSNQMQNDQNIIKSDQNTKKEPNDQQKRKIIQKFEAIKEKLKQKGKFQWKNSCKIEAKIGKLLGATRNKIYKWKKELNLNKKMGKNFYEQKKNEFIERFNEFKSLYGQGKQKEFVKKLGISERVFIKWKKELMPNYNKNAQQLEYVKRSEEMKLRNPILSDSKIAESLGSKRTSLIGWKKFDTAPNEV